MAWFGNFFLIAGQFKLGRKHWCAPWICNVGNALYLVYSAEKHTWALFAMTAVAFVIMVRCAILWRPRQYPHQRLLSEHPVNSPLTSSGVFRIGRTAGALALPGPQVCRKLINREEKNAPRYLEMPVAIIAALVMLVDFDSAARSDEQAQLLKVRETV
jgi:hypothetical protein